ncbi:MAG: hypothetical protein C5B52_14780 [Bacteroidetes bacterium]|nr:MAG: hypothetical protein C5B52_14780 [Bacteroidota bacterium]
MWIAMGAGLIVLLVAAIQRKNTRACKGVEIEIRASGNNYFIDKDDVRRLLNATEKDYVGRPLKDFRLAKMENQLKGNVWVSKANVFFDNNEVLRIKVSEREPIARIFTAGENSFYLDSNLARLPLSDEFSARVPVFTGFPNAGTKLTKSDSSLLKQIKTLSQYLVADSFWMAQIEQVDINAEGKFEMIPNIGEHVILFGDASDLEKKFHRLYVFYHEVLSKIGWNKYAAINVQYRGQVVAIKNETTNTKTGNDSSVANEQRVRQMMSWSPQQWTGGDSLSRALPNYPATRSVAPRNTVTPLKTTGANGVQQPKMTNTGKNSNPKKPVAVMPGKKETRK